MNFLSCDELETLLRDEEEKKEVTFNNNQNSNQKNLEQDSKIINNFQSNNDAVLDEVEPEKFSFRDNILMRRLQV